MPRDFPGESETRSAKRVALQRFCGCGCCRAAGANPVTNSLAAIYTTRFPDGRKATPYDTKLCSGHDKHQRLVPSRISIISPSGCSLLRPFATRAIIKTADSTALLFGYALTIGIVSSQHPHDGWVVDLLLMKLLPPSFTHPSQLVVLLQFMIWSFIRILHLLRSPGYWPECGLVAIGVSVAVGGWFGLRAMVGSLVIVAFSSLLGARAIE